MDLQTEIEPPGLDLDEDDDGEPYVGVHVALIEHDGTRRAGYGGIPASADDPDTVAAALIDALVGVAATRGPELHAAVARRIRRL